MWRNRAQSLIAPSGGILANTKPPEPAQEKKITTTKEIVPADPKPEPQAGGVVGNIFNTASKIGDQFMPQSPDTKDKSYGELKGMYKNAKNEYNQWKNTYNRAKKGLADGTYNEQQFRQIEESYNRAKKNKKELKKAKVAKGWDNFKKGFSKAIGIGSKIAGVAGTLFGL